MNPKGAAPFVASTQTFESEGVEYQIRRLGLADMFRLAGIVSAIVTNGTVAFGQWLLDMKVRPTEVFAAIVALGIERGEDRILEFLGSMIAPLKSPSPIFAAVGLEGITDARLFPMAVAPLLIEKLVEHPDVKAFFSNWETIKPTIEPMMAKIEAQKKAEDERLQSAVRKDNGKQSDYAPQEETVSLTP